MPEQRTEQQTISTQAPQRCQECPALFTDGSRWRAYVTDDAQPLLVFYCPDCAEREFGPL